jgi:hypothetical protein
MMTHYSLPDSFSKRNEVWANPEQRQVTKNENSTILRIPKFRRRANVANYPAACQWVFSHQQRKTLGPFTAAFPPFLAALIHRGFLRGKLNEMTGRPFKSET